MGLFRDFFHVTRLRFGIKSAPEKEENVWSLINKSPNIDGYHVFMASPKYDYSNVSERTLYPYSSLEYAGSTDDFEVIKKIKMHPYSSHKMVVMKGKLYELAPVEEKYTETVERTKIIGMELREAE